MDEKKFALLIDADNISSKYIKTILDELAKYGELVSFGANAIQN